MKLTELKQSKPSVRFDKLNERAIFYFQGNIFRKCNPTGKDNKCTVVSLDWDTPLTSFSEETLVTPIVIEEIIYRKDTIC